MYRRSGKVREQRSRVSRCKRRNSLERNRTSIMIAIFSTTFTLIAFAANSLLCRMALGEHLIDPLSFTALRLVSGALGLLCIISLVDRVGAAPKTSGAWGCGVALFVYAAAFSLAYVSLSAGMGALILFGTVQVTMIGAALKSGERLGTAQWAGSATALGGLIYLVFPGISAPDPAGALLMCISGIAWGLYSIGGRGIATPIAMTAGNFLRAAPMALIAGAIGFATIRLKPLGVLLAVISGAVASGLGYVLWYKALRSLTTTQASVVQLIVPVLAAFGGVTLLAERVTLRLVVATALILGGVALTLIKSQSAQNSMAAKK